MAASDLHALKAALLLLPGCLGEVRRCAISCTPIPTLLGCILSENESDQLSLRPSCLSVRTLSKIVKESRPPIASAASYVLNRSSFISKENHLLTHLADFFESFAILQRAA
jgi:hypothetical protein